MNRTLHIAPGHRYESDRESDSGLVRVIGGARDGHFAPAKSIYIYPIGHDPNDIYVLRRLRVGNETVKALVLNTLSDSVAVNIYRQHAANDSEAS
jgi:hypothetical protein